VGGVSGQSNIVASPEPSRLKVGIMSTRALRPIAIALDAFRIALHFADAFGIALHSTAPAS
jgi:hypothetical protein